MKNESNGRKNGHRSLPKEDVNLRKVAEKVGHTSRQTCGSCHFSGGGGDAVKHADLSETLNWPDRRCDVHMGGYDFRCSKCHETLTGEKTCNRCHQDSQEVDFRKLAQQETDFETMYARGRDVKALIGQTDYIGFRELGYKGDPIIYGGRFKKLPLGRKEDSNK